MRRLSRYEYRNTVRDLLGVDFDPRLTLPADEVGYGFDHIGDVLSQGHPALHEQVMLPLHQVAEVHVFAVRR